MNGERRAEERPWAVTTLLDHPAAQQPGAVGCGFALSEARSLMLLDQGCANRCTSRGVAFLCRADLELSEDCLFIHDSGCELDGQVFWMGKSVQKTLGCEEIACPTHVSRCVHLS